ncbi:4-diphosphocytidyl-2C-methyl-D-erythritol synthase [Rippkaea orientalis PCC 8801]|uniref:4-diphosphocytidyl-2C-methyl-D-erythritol synthase n=1 Tax=Rippkaea orientalis (strain PCC 8801 / RF-1) TaxID=41431 RepID=B7K024_RIPO1|nr:nucleotidyltransferase family protein [Rippkaea orientalis]ACK66171.1 4-diphosphocytidyl-2C-methyl-D-erythritol synthase [Rippkaea orientalis PCC 8801]
MVTNKLEKVAIAILAAGRGSRFNSNQSKLLAQLQRRSLLDWSLAAAIKSQLRPILVVVGYQASQVSILDEPVRIVYNPAWQQGIASSLKAAIEAVESDFNIDALIIGLGDQPLIHPQSYRRLAQAYVQGASFAVATYQQARRNPVLLARSLWPVVMKLEGDQGAKVLMSDYTVVEVPCDGSPVDVDTWEDLEQIERMNKDEQTTTTYS